MLGVASCNVSSNCQQATKPFSPVGCAEALSEQELREWLLQLDAQNPRLKVFVGQGSYDHYTPAVIPYLTQRSEFITAYTPNKTKRLFPHFK